MPDPLRPIEAARWTVRAYRTRKDRKTGRTVGVLTVEEPNGTTTYTGHPGQGFEEMLRILSKRATEYLKEESEKPRA